MDDFRKISLLEKLSAEGSKAATLRRAQKYAESRGDYTGRLTPAGARAAGLPVPDRWANAGPEATTEIAPGETEQNLALNKRMKARAANKRGVRDMADGIPGAVGATQAVVRSAKNKLRETGKDLGQAAGDAAGWAKRGLGIARERVTYPASAVPVIRPRSPEQQAKEKAHQERAMSATSSAPAKPADKPASPGLGTPAPGGGAAKPPAAPAEGFRYTGMGGPPEGARAQRSLGPGHRAAPVAEGKVGPASTPSGGSAPAATAKPGGSSLGAAMTRGAGAKAPRQYAAGKEWMATTAGRKKAWAGMKGKERRKSQTEWWKGHTSTRSKAGDKWAANRDKKRGAASAVAKARVEKTAPTPKKTGPIARARVLGGATAAAAPPLRQVPGFTPKPMGTDIFAAGQKKPQGSTRQGNLALAPPSTPRRQAGQNAIAAAPRTGLTPPTPSSQAGAPRAKPLRLAAGGKVGQGPQGASAPLPKVNLPKPQPALPPGGLAKPILKTPPVKLVKPVPGKKKIILGKKPPIVASR